MERLTRINAEVKREIQVWVWVRSIRVVCDDITGRVVKELLFGPVGQQDTKHQTRQTATTSNYCIDRP